MTDSNHLAASARLPLAGALRRKMRELAG